MKMIFSCFAFFLLEFSVHSAAQPPILGWQAGTSQDSDELTAQEPSFIFKQVEPVLRHETQVPLRLPSFLPYVDEKNPIFAKLEHASSRHYRILLGFTEDCEGGNACLYGSVEASDSPSDFYTDDEAAVTPVKLRGGIKGQLVESVCRAYCNEAYVRWKEEGFYYSIGMKAGEKEVLIKVANSAIAAGRARKH